MSPQNLGRSSEEFCLNSGRGLSDTLKPLGFKVVKMGWGTAMAVLHPYFRSCPVASADGRIEDSLGGQGCTRSQTSPGYCRSSASSQQRSRKKRSRRRNCPEESAQQNFADDIGQLLHTIPARLAAGLKQTMGHLARPHSQALFAALNLGPHSKRFTQPDTAAEVRHQADLKQLFKQIDADGNGKLDAAELQEALAHLGLPCSPDYLAEMLNKYDENHDGEVDFAEFQHYVGRRRSTIERAFDKFDTDKSGSITEPELLEVLKRAGVPASASDAQHMVQMLDSHNTGEVTFQDFCRYITMLPDAQVTHNNVLFCWMDSADWLSGVEYRLCMVPPKQPLQRLLAGGISGALARTLVAPFERLRTIMQSNSSMTFSSAATGMWRDGGLFGLFKGNLLTVAKNLPFTAIQFAVYDQAKDALLGFQPHKKELTQSEKVAAGCIAGFMACIVVYPLDMLRTCASMSGAPKGFRPLVRSVVQTSGLRGLYRGIAPALMEECMTTGLGFWAYEMGNNAFKRKFGRPPKPRERGIVGGMTACFVMTVTLPLLVVSRRLQLQGFNGRPVLYANVLDCFSQILHKEGPKAFYRGMLCSYLKVAPSIGATYFLYALLTQSWGIGGIRQYDHGSAPGSKPPLSSTTPT